MRPLQKVFGRGSFTNFFTRVEVLGLVAFSYGSLRPGAPLVVEFTNVLPPRISLLCYYLINIRTSFAESPFLCLVIILNGTIRKKT